VFAGVGELGVDRFADRAPRLACGTGERVVDAPSGRACVFDGVGEQRAGELVASVRDGHGDLTLGAAILLRRAPRTRTVATRRTLEADVDQAGLGEFVEMECGDGTAGADRFGGLVATDPIVTVDQQRVQITAQRLAPTSSPRSGSFRASRT
jgi:hypothetical protein